MEAVYSSVPEVDDSLKGLIAISALTILVGIIIWYINKQINKEKNENRNIRQG